MPERVRTSAFARSDTALQLAWVLGGFVGIAMPLKYLAGQPLAVKITGMIHGILFVVFCVALLRAMLEAHWPFRRCALIFIASFIPLVPFFLDRKLKQWEVATP